MSHVSPSLDTDDLRDVLIRSGNSYVELHARSAADGRFTPIVLKNRFPKAVGFLERDWCVRSEIMRGPRHRFAFQRAAFLGHCKATNSRRTISIFVSRKSLAASFLSFSTQSDKTGRRRCHRLTRMPLHLDVRLNQNAMAFRRQQFLQGLQRSYTTGGILFAVAATEANAADDFR